MEIKELICPRCGTEIFWMNDYMSYEVTGEFTEDDTSITSFYSCPNCGATIEVIDPSDEDKKDYSFWNE